VQAYEQQLASKVTPPTEQEIERYKEQHPNTFAQRKLYAVDQIKIGKSLDPKLLEQLKPLHSLDDVERALLGAGVDYIRAPGSIDARLVSPKVMDQITKLPPNEPFVMPVGNMIVISQITKATTLPLTGQPANELARQALLAERRTKAIADRLSQLRKEAGEIKYQNGYSPSRATAQQQ
jgi:EpsD family peptidyl-prolyl cis-trans isomerase